MFLHILILLIGAAMILVGANCMTSGSSAVARRLGVSDFVIGLTLVAFGSSAPDLAVGIFSALKGHTQFALGNVVGSCIFDGLLVVGIVALVRPLKVERDVLYTQLPQLLISYVAVMICANAIFLDGEPRNIITRGDGLLLLMIFGLMLWQTLQQGDPDAPEPASSATAPTKKPTRTHFTTKQGWMVTLQILGGLGLLIWGGNLFVDGASGIALEAHVSETVIGLTVVALGTSLPDLATSVVAAVRHHPGIAIGNVVGSCLMDSLVVLGATSLVAPLPMDGVGNVDLLIMLGGGVALTVFALMSGQRTVSRWEGALMIAGYGAYLVHVLMRA